MSKQPLTLEARLDRVSKWLIGLWRFHAHGEPRLWCCTYRVRGEYYDTHGADTPEEALDRVWRSIRSIQSAEKRKQRHGEEENG